MSTYPIDQRPGLAVTDLFLSVFGPPLVAAVVLLLAIALNIL